MSNWRIHWENGVVSDWMGTDPLYDTLWGKEKDILYIESEDMKAHIDKVLELMRAGHTAMSQWGEVLLYREGAYYIEERVAQEYEIRAALQIRYTADPEDYIEDQAYIEGMLSKL